MQLETDSNVAIKKENRKDLPYLHSLDEMMLEAVVQGVFPGAVLLVGVNGQVLFEKSFGNKSLKVSRDESPSPMTIDTVFDVGGITSSIVTTTLVMQLVESGKLKLDDKVIRYVQGFGVFGKSPILISHLLSHTSGLASWEPFFETLIDLNSSSRMGILTSKGARDYVYTMIHKAELKRQPGELQEYSDPGFILLGEIVEILSGLSLDRALHRYISQPLGLKSTSFIDLSLIKRRGIHPITELIAPTENCPWRKRILCGEAHDDNAWAMGGIAGHNGLFTTARDLHTFCSEMNGCFQGKSSFIRQDIVKYFWSYKFAESDASWHLGWDSPSEENGLLGTRLSGTSVGNFGFTGCSIWMEPEHGLDVILLTNRIHPSRSNRKIKNFRPLLHDKIMELLTAG